MCQTRGVPLSCLIILHPELTVKDLTHKLINESISFCVTSFFKGSKHQYVRPLKCQIGWGGDTFMLYMFIRCILEIPYSFICQMHFSKAEILKRNTHFFKKGVETVYFAVLVPWP